MKSTRKNLAVVFALVALCAIMFLSIFLGVYYGVPVESKTQDSSFLPLDYANYTSEEPNPNPIVTTEDGFKLQLSIDGTYYSVTGYTASARNITIPLSYKGISIKRIGNSAFLNKKSLEHVELNEQIEYIGEGVFDGCDNLIFESDGVGGRYLGTSENKFYYFYKPDKFTIKDFTVNVNTVLVAAYAFSDCSQIESVIIPEHVKYIGYKAIGNAPTLKSVTLPFVGETSDGENNSHLGYVFGARTLGGTVSFAPKSLKEVTIIGGERIAKNSFYGIDMIESLTLPYLGNNINDTANSYIGYFWGANNADDNVNIPSVLKNITVVSGKISYKAFCNCPKIEDVNLPEGITNLSSNCFQNCDSLERVSIPNSVISIGSSSFMGCGSLTSIVIPNSVTSIGSSAFSGCKSLGGIVLPIKLKSIGRIAFHNCSSLAKIQIPSEVTMIESDTFSGCSSLMSVDMPKGIKGIADYAFDGCSKLISIELPSGITSIGSYAFNNCSELNSIDVPNGVTSIGSYAFSKCRNLKKVKLPSDLTSIKNWTFGDCSSLTNIELPSKLISIGSYAFIRCNSLYFVKNNSELTLTIGSSDNGEVAYYARVIEDKDGNIIKRLGANDTIIVNDFLYEVDSQGNYKMLSYLGGEDTVILPKTVNGKSYTIYYLRGVKNLILPDTFTSIGDYAFYGCSSLTSISIPSSVTSIGSLAFSGCSSLTNIELPSGITSIGSSVFYGCSSLTSISIPSSVTSIGSLAFSGCSSLTNIELPSGITSIGSSAFYGCSSLTSIKLPNSLRQIGSNAFNGCFVLQKIIYCGEIDEWRHVIKAGDWDDGITCTMMFAPDSGAMFETNDDISEFYLAGYNGTDGILNVTGSYAGRAVTEVYAYGLYNNKTIVEVFLPNTISVIGEYAFANCSILESINIPNSVNRIDFGLLSGCISLERLDLPFLGQTLNGEYGYLGYVFGASSSFDNAEYVPENLKFIHIEYCDSIANYAFYDLRNIEVIEIPSTVTQIGNYAFAGCQALTEFVIPNTVVEIGNYAFAECRAFTEFVFPDGVTTIGASVLHGDNNINSITIGANLTLSGIADYVNNNPLFGLDKSSSSLEEYIVAPENTEFMTDEYGVLYLKLNIALSGAAQNVPVSVVDAPATSNLSYYVLPQYIVEVMPYAFAYNSTLKTVELEYVRRIGNNAFMECDRLINVIFSDPMYDMPERLDEYIGGKQYSQRIENRAFMGCISLMKADLQVSTIVEIGEEAFLDCNLLKTVILGENMRKLGMRAFGSSDVGGSTLERIEVAESNQYFKGIEGVLFAINYDETLTLELYPACKPVYVDGEILYVNGETQYAAEYSLPAIDNNGNNIQITGIESYAFTNAVYLDDLTIDPGNDLRVGDYAFADSMIQHIYIGSSVTSLGLRRGEGEYTVFSGDRYLTDIEVSSDNPYYSSKGGVLFDKNATRLIKYPAAKVGREYIVPSSVNTIASMAFKDNKSIGIVTINSDLYVVGLEAFYGCSDLQVIYFNHVYAPRAVMENAFTVNLDVDAAESQAILGYSPSYYNNLGDGYGWRNYDEIYNIVEYDTAPVYKPEHGNSIYYAVVVVDKSGKTVNGTWVSITDYNGNTETVEAQNGIATFWSYVDADTDMFAITFDHKYSIMVYDGDGLYAPYVNDGVYLDGKTLVTYITLQMDMGALELLQPSVAGVSCNDKEINSESVEINKAAFDYEGYELINESLGFSSSNVHSIGTVHETIPISVIVYFNSEYKNQVSGDGCILLQNGATIMGCELSGIEIRNNSATYTFEVPVYRLIPEIPIIAKFTMTIKDIEFSADTILNIDIIDFSIKQDDISLGTDDVSLDLSAAGETIMKLLGGKSLNFNIGKNFKAYIDIDDSEITVGIRGDWTKNKNNSTNISSLSPQAGYEKYKQSNNKGSYFYQFKAIVNEKRNGQTKTHALTYNIRFYRDPNIEDFYYYRMYIYENAWENNIATLYGKLNGGSVLSAFGFSDTSGLPGRERLAEKAQTVYLGHWSKLINDLKNTTTKSEEEFKKIVAKGYVYSENEKTEKYQSTTNQTFSAALAGELVFKYDRDQGLHLVRGSITGELGYVLKHHSQFVVWFIPITLDVQVDLGGKVNLKVVIDNNRKITMDEAKMTLSANISASLGIGCSLASAGITGSIGTVFVLDFYPEFGVESWSINGKIGLYAKILWWRKDWTIWQGSYDIIKSNKTAAAMIAAQSMGAMYLASSYERITPYDVNEDATLFVSGQNLYKVYYISAYGRDGYDENNFVKLAVAMWTGSDWTDGVIIDDNGCNDASYSLFDDNGKIKLIYVQNDGTIKSGLDDIYNDAGHIVIKSVDIVGGKAQNITSITTSTGNYSYLHQISIVDSVPTAVWVENADNNVFGVSPYNYIDANGNSHVYATTANSIWISRFENGHWSTAVCLIDGLSAITNLVLTTAGDVYYIEDSNGDLSDTNDRMLFGMKRAETTFTMINSPYVSVTNAYAEGDYVVYRAVAIGDTETIVGLYRLKNSDVDATLILPEETVDQMSNNYKPVYDETGGIFAYVYYDNETWAQDGVDVTGSVLYGVFYDGEWSNTIKLIQATVDEYISSFDVYKYSEDSLLITIDYTNADNSLTWSVTQIVMLEEKVSLVEYMVDYTEQILYVTVINNGAVASDISVSVDGTDSVLSNKLSIGATETFGIRISDNKTPIIKLLAGTRVFGTIKGVDFNYADFAIYSKQIVIGGKNILLIAVRNNGNIASSGELYFKAGTDISNIETSGERIALPNISVGGIYYLELALDEILSANSDVVALYVKCIAEPNDETLLLDNVCYVTYNECTLASDDLQQTPRLSANYFERLENDSDSLMIEYSDFAYYISNVYCGDAILSGNEFHIYEDTRQVELLASYLKTLLPGEYIHKVEFVGPNGNYFCEFALKVFAEYNITWSVDNGLEIVNTICSVKEGVLPIADFIPIHIDDAGYTYEFVGWDIDGDDTADKIFAAYADMTYVAVFALKAKEFTVTWKIDEMEFAEQYAYGSYPVFMGNANKNDYNFVGWDTDNDGTINSVTTVADNVTYVAIYEEIPVHETHTSSDWIVDVEATCTTEGHRYKECNVCGVQTEEEIMPKLAHEYGEWITDLVASCSQAGLKHRKCTICKEAEESEAINKLEHTESDWIVDVESNCAHKGSRHKECEVCDTITVVEEIPMISHTYGNVQTKDATCTEDGYTYKACSICEHEEIITTITALGHSEGDWIVDVEPNCTHKGSRHKECEVCDVITAVEEIPMTAHTYGNMQTKDATCTEDGYTYKACSICEHEEIITTITALGHSEGDWIVDVEPNCAHKGSRHKECEVCDTITVVEEIPMTTHTYGNVQTKDSTCTEDGYTYKVCSICGHEDVLSTITAMGHSEADWIVDVEPDCAHKGSRHKECEVCDVITVVEETPMTSHTYGNVQTKDATCTEDGCTYKVCSICEHEEILTTITSLGHSEGEWIVDVKSDCAHIGSRHKECEVCDTITVVEEIPMTAHTYGNVQTKDATCTEDGYTYKMCSICGHEDILSTITSHGHIEGDWVIDSKPMAGVTGYHHKECVECGSILASESIEALPLNDASKALTIAIVVAIVLGCIIVAISVAFTVVFIKKRKRMR